MIFYINRYPPDQILSLFNQKISNTSTHHDLKAFVEQYFYPAGSDLVDVIPSDWVPNPIFIDHILQERKAR
jgi:hypothetical protein